jgi:penicillin-binding protein 1C
MIRYFKKGSKQNTVLLIISCIGICFISFSFWYSLPAPLFNDPLSTVVFDRNGELIGARIADDGQWRFTEPDSIPEKYKKAVVSFEDRYFYYHPGFNPFSIARAFFQNIKEGEIISGGSTISMQVIRLSRKGKPRSVSEKLIELVLAFRLELKYSKEDILRMYAANAPFGGNVVGIETASWRYFGRDPFSLSWAETAALAVLPNAPALIHPGKNRKMLLQKRNRLLKKLYSDGEMDQVSYELALLEELPDKPKPLPQMAFHLTDRLYISHKGKRISSGIEAELQERCNRVVERNQIRLNAMQIRNAACMIVEVETGQVLSYVGNIRNPSHPEYGGDVDVIMAERSSGSILKPFLFTFMQYRGHILPKSLIADIPTRYGTYSPKNYNRDYEGVVNASVALSRSLNVPAARMLLEYGVSRFCHDLNELGFSTINKSSSHYGLSLVLGGAEVSLWELAGAYSSMARMLNHFNESQGKYFSEDWHMPKIFKKNISINNEGSEQGLIGAGAAWLCFQALQDVNRPGTETGWELFSSSRKVAWKTGTSFGFRDGWAIATTPEYVVAVWTGNSDGEGMPGLTGLNAAAPLLFDLLNVLPATTWFGIPYDDLEKVPVCHESGHRPGKFCMNIDTILISPAGRSSEVCPYHDMIHLDKSGKFRVSTNCYDQSQMIHKSWFVLPPAQEWYYRKKDPSYKPVPPMMKGCSDSGELQQIQIIYPDPGAVIYIPNELDGEKGKVIFEAVHRNPGNKIFWHIDNKYIGITQYFHQLSVKPEKGKHQLILVDESGQSTRVNFEIIDKKSE